MKKLSNVERRIIEEIIKNNGKYFVFKLHNKYKISITEINKAVNSLTKNNLIVLDGLIVKLNPDNDNWSFWSSILTHSDNSRPWRECPQKFKQPRLEVNSSYIPNRKKMY